MKKSFAIFVSAYTLGLGTTFIVGFLHPSAPFSEIQLQTSNSTLCDNEVFPSSQLEPFHVALRQTHPQNEPAVFNIGSETLILSDSDDPNSDVVHWKARLTQYFQEGWRRWPLPETFEDQSLDEWIHRPRYDLTLINDLAP